MADNGWRSGRDPALRWLRIITALALLGVFIFLSIDDRPVERLPIIGLALAALLILLGYEGLVRVPLIGRKERDDDD